MPLRGSYGAAAAAPFESEERPPHEGFQSDNVRLDRGSKGVIESEDLHPP